MSTVFWAHKLVGNVVESTEEDFYQLFNYAEQLDTICSELSISLFSSMHDYTDMQFNLEEQELPEGMEDTSQLMALKGNWVPAVEAVAVLSSIQNHLTSGNAVQIPENDRSDLIKEIAKVLSYAEKASKEQGKFNLSAIM